METEVSENRVWPLKSDSLPWEILSSCILNAERLALPADRHYLTLYVTCTDATKSFQDHLQALVNAAEAVESVGSSDASQLIDRVTRKCLTLKFVEVESTKKYAVESQRLSYQDLNLEEKLVQLSELLTLTYAQPVLFVVDELDRMESRTICKVQTSTSSSPLLRSVS